MWKLKSIKKSDLKNKKWCATFEKVMENNNETKKKHEKHTYFGASGYEDYTMHKDKIRRTLYRIRHKYDRLDDPTSPGALSYWILWGNSTSIQTNIREFRKKYHV
jgi:hypothetical protein